MAKAIQIGLILFVTCLLLLGSSVQTIASPATHGDRPAAASGTHQSVAAPQIAMNASVVNGADSLTLRAGYSLYLFAMSVGGASTSTGLYRGSYARGYGANGEISSALAVTNSNRNNFTTADGSFTIGGVGISGYGSYNATYGIDVPPVEPTTTFSYSFNVSDTATVVFLLTAGGQCCVSATGIPGLSILAEWNAGGGVGLEIAEANLTVGHYVITEQSTNNDRGSNTRADIVGVFQFYATGSTSSSSWPSWLWGVGIGLVLIVVVVMVVARRRTPPALPAPPAA